MAMVSTFLDSFFISFSIVIYSIYFLMGLLSMYKLVHYNKTNKMVDYSVLLSSPYAPGISVLAPAYNESKTIIDNIKALLAIQYGDFEVIIINDGSKDDSLEKVIREYQLEKVDYVVNYRIPTKQIRGIYRSTNRAYHFLTVIDKENGGKADSLNAGINISRHELFVAIDVDSVLIPDALLKLVKPFLQTEHERVLATGGAIRVANSCHLENGHLIDIEVPKNLWAKFQVIEYTRAFLIGRIALSKVNGLMLISGALGLFDKDIVINCGGYNRNTVGEDMELIVRMRKYAYEHKIRHRVEYIPDPLCWTEVPSTLKVLKRQRNRWARGVMDTLYFHKDVFLNRKHGVMGLVAYPYYLFLEWMTPILESIGITYVIFLFIIGQLNWKFLCLFFALGYLFSVAFSCTALLFEEITFHRYDKVRHQLKLFLIPFVEPLIFHPLNVYWSILGNISYFKGEKGWGNMERTGFSSSKKKSNI